jgi:hypothetical protein
MDLAFDDMRQQVLGHFFRYRPLLPIGWNPVQVVGQHRRKMTIKRQLLFQAASQPTFIDAQSYSKLVISRNYKNN